MQNAAHLPVGKCKRRETQERRRPFEYAGDGKVLCAAERIHIKARVKVGRREVDFIRLRRKERLLHVRRFCLRREIVR